MLKEIALMLCAIVALSAAATLYSETSSTGDNSDGIVEGCEYTNQQWGSEDGTKFYICIPGTNTAIEQSCPTGTFFVRNATALGCVPFDLVNSNCVYNVEPGTCTGNNLNQPQPASDPTQFYFCPSAGATPVLLTCASGKAFVNQDGYLGCFLWPQWRVIRDCYD